MQFRTRRPGPRYTESWRHTRIPGKPGTSGPRPPGAPCGTPLLAGTFVLLVAFRFRRGVARNPYRGDPLLCRQVEHLTTLRAMRNVHVQAIHANEDHVRPLEFAIAPETVEGHGARTPFAIITGTPRAYALSRCSTVYATSALSHAAARPARASSSVPKW